MVAPTKPERDRGYTQADIEDVSDTPEFTEQEMAKAKPFAEVFPELAASAKRTRGKQRAPTKQLISLRLDRAVVEAFKAGGSGWQRRINDALKSAVGAVDSPRPPLGDPGHRRSLGSASLTRIIALDNPPAPDRGRGAGPPGRSGCGRRPRTPP